MNLQSFAARGSLVQRSLAFAALLCFVPCHAHLHGEMRGQMGSSTSLRNLRGIITDSGHEPIRNAVVELRNSNTNQVISYITDTTGQYSFKRLDSHTDFQVWVLFRGHRSVTRSISMFDGHMDKVINFTVRTY